MTASLRTHVVSFLFLLLLAVLAVVVPPPSLLARADAATPTTTSSAHPYGDPVWFPLRNSASIGCAKSGCGTKADHGYWAIDFLATRGDPVYPAGAGIAHIGGNSGACVTSGPDNNGGRWVWVDHGAGVVTKYHHLDSIAIKDGQLVTPATRIGAMGSSGDISPCKTAYLHFEVRNGGLKGIRVDPGQLFACTAGGRVSLPAALGGSNWDDRAIHPARRLNTPASSSACITPTWLSTPATPKATVRRSDKAVAVDLGTLPAGATSAMIRLQTYHPSTKAWGTDLYRTVPAGAARTTFVVDNTHGYRVDLTVHGTGGWSAWSGKLAARGVPAAPRAPRYLTWPKKSYVHYGWYRPDDLGSKVTKFDVARRCSKPGKAFGSWKTYTQGQSDTYRNLRGLTGYNRCEVKVRAKNAVGTGAWSKTSTVRR